MQVPVLSLLPLVLPCSPSLRPTCRQSRAAPVSDLHVVSPVQPQSQTYMSSVPFSPSLRRRQSRSAPVSDLHVVSPVQPQSQTYMSSVPFSPSLSSDLHVVSPVQPQSQTYMSSVPFSPSLRPTCRQSRSAPVLRSTCFTKSYQNRSNSGRRLLFSAGIVLCIFT